MPALQANLFSAETVGREIFTELLSGEAFTLEHIISNGQAGAPHAWYDQEQDEWVALLQGDAELELEDGTLLSMARGDVLLIEAHCRHRVARVSNDAVWLALHHHGAT